MNKVLILQGLPASGKSTYAKKLIIGSKKNWIRFNKDDSRLQYFNSEWSHDREDFVIEMRDFGITLAMMRGYDIIIDDTNFAPKHIESITEMVRLHNESLQGSSIVPLPKYEVEVRYFDVDLQTCIDRNSKRPNPVPEGVIIEMYEKYVKGKS